jgi:hypothetical protein
MYVPPNIAGVSTNIVPTPQPVSTAITLAPVVSGARQTQLAVTGPGAALIPNAANYKPSNVTTRTAASASTSVVLNETQMTDAFETATFSGSTVPRANAPAILLQPRPAYIAAQFLAQDLSPQEASSFFAPTIQPQVTRDAQRQQNILRDMRVALGVQEEMSTPITIKQSALNSATPVQMRTQLPIVAESVVRRNAFVQAYNTANIRNAQLASAHEVDTSL